MIHTTSAALFFLAAGIFTSVSILSAYQILFAIPLIYFTWKAFQEKKLNLPLSAWILIAFSVVAALSLFLNLELVPKPSKNFGRIKYFLFGAVGIYVFKYWLAEVSDKTKLVITNVFFLSIVIAGLYAIGEIIFTSEKRAKTLTDTMRYGYGTGMILLSVLSAILHREKFKSWFNWKFAVAAFIFGFLGMYFTYTRGALLGFLCGIPFVVFYFKKKLGLIFGGLALTTILVLAGIYFFGSGNYESRFLANKNLKSDVMRRSQWDAAMIAMKEKPVLGYGLSNFHSQLKRIKEQYDLPKKEYNDAHAHNLFLEIGSGTGFIGLTLFVAWLLVWAFECFQGDVLVRALTIPFGVAFIVSSQFEVTLDANNASMLFFIYAISSAMNLKTHTPAT